MDPDKKKAHLTWRRAPFFTFGGLQNTVCQLSYLFTSPQTNPTVESNSSTEGNEEPVAAVGLSACDYSESENAFCSQLTIAEMDAGKTGLYTCGHVTGNGNGAANLQPSMLNAKRNRKLKEKPEGEQIYIYVKGK